MSMFTTMEDDLKRLPAPKQARALITRDKLVVAAIECLSERGVAGTSTTRIAKRAGVSQGALFKHFPTKALLLSVATDTVFEEMRERFVVEALERSEPSREMISGLEVLWDIFQDPRLKSVFELYMATRTDDELGRVLAPVVEEHFERVMEIAEIIFPSAAGTQRFGEAVTSLMLVLQGGALMIGMAPEGHQSGLPLGFLAQFAVAILGTPDLAALAEARGDD